MDKLVTVKDFEEQASKVLDLNTRGYYNSGANHELALRQNQEMFNFVKINPRVLRNVSQVCLRARLLGQETAIPFGIAPTAMQGLAHDGAEKNTFRAAAAHGTAVTLSTLSTTPMDEAVKAAPDVLRLFQLYVTKNREIAKSLVREAEANGFSALVLTVDAPQLGKREADQRNNFHLPQHLRLAILEKYSRFNVESSEGSGLLKFFSDQIDASLDWEDAKWLQSITKLPVVLKGIQCREDAELAGRLRSASLSRLQAPLGNEPRRQAALRRALHSRNPARSCRGQAPTPRRRGVRGRRHQIRGGHF
jgi:isopentenyl diphosphate isomerase/L-lactate dehydrogenase-like FMN-dependent dehydrogenase